MVLVTFRNALLVLFIFRPDQHSWLVSIGGMYPVFHKTKLYPEKIPKILVW